MSIAATGQEGTFIRCDSDEFQLTRKGDLMNWYVVSAVSKFTGVIAVVISLLYVSRQISMSNRLARAEASR